MFLCLKISVGSPPLSLATRTRVRFKKHFFLTIRLILHYQSLGQISDHVPLGDGEKCTRTADPQPDAGAGAASSLGLSLCGCHLVSAHPGMSLPCLALCGGRWKEGGALSPRSSSLGRRRQLGLLPAPLWEPASLHLPQDHSTSGATPLLRGLGPGF